MLVGVGITKKDVFLWGMFDWEVLQSCWSIDCAFANEKSIKSTFSLGATDYLIVVVHTKVQIIIKHAIHLIRSIYNILWLLFLWKSVLNIRCSFYKYFALKFQKNDVFRLKNLTLCLIIVVFFAFSAQTRRKATWGATIMAALFVVWIPFIRCYCSTIHYKSIFIFTKSFFPSIFNFQFHSLSMSREFITKSFNFG